MSIVKMVAEELNIELSDDMRAASITDSISPLNPGGSSSFTNITKATLVQPDLFTIT